MRNPQGCQTVAGGRWGKGERPPETTSGGESTPEGWQTRTAIAESARTGDSGTPPGYAEDLGRLSGGRSPLFPRTTIGYHLPTLRVASGPEPSQVVSDAIFLELVRKLLLS